MEKENALFILIVSSCVDNLEWLAVFIHNVDDAELQIAVLRAMAVRCEELQQYIDGYLEVAQNHRNNQDLPF